MQRRKKRCYFISNKISFIDYKDVNLLKRFLTDHGKILPSRITGVSAQYQRKLAHAVKRARQAGILSAVTTAR
jgi:small subunit ribosomal protein S18